MRQAVQAIETAVKTEPMNPAYLKQAGRICALAGQTEKAIQYYRKALQWGGDDETVSQALESLSGSPSSRRGLFGRVS
jgi:Flp pilus assembly protein TadD